MSAQTFFVWDIQQVTCTSSKDSSWEQATHDFEALSQQPVDEISPNIIELADRLVDEARTSDYSEVFYEAYVNTNLEMKKHPKSACVAIPTPEALHGEALDLIAPLCEELGLVFYDTRGMVAYPDGTIYPPNIARGMALLKEKRALAKQSADIYKPEADVPRDREDFEKILHPFMHDCLERYGYQSNQISSANDIDYLKVDGCTKATPYGHVRLTGGAEGKNGYFRLKIHAYFVSPAFAKIYDKVSAPTKLSQQFPYLKLDYINVCDKNFADKQKQIPEFINTEFASKLDEVDKIDSYNQLFLLLHDKIARGHSHGERVDKQLILAKLAGREDYDDLIIQYRELIDNSPNDYVKNRMNERWDRLLEILSTVEPLE
ncbi:hypothetical protein [Psychrobacter sp. K31L]|uniref:hypothetical protein n=1 Tax=Psychrobacter sp. K31L TaxID=2820758 RepID=UPI001B330B50|nr:hypothetical protein [Psychrobacter sp. K31L]MBP3946627.1 hypothetical protein [Psychrobacter sp. K31L]